MEAELLKTMLLKWKQYW